MNDLQLQILSFLKSKGESSTKDIGARFSEFEDRKALSAFLGNLNREGLIVKNNPNRWSLTSIGRSAIDGEGLMELTPEVESAVAMISSWKGKDGSTEKRIPSPFDMACQLQHEIPNGSSLVIESDEVFLAWRGARFAIQKPEDLQAFQAIQEAYIGEVA